MSMRIPRVALLWLLLGWLFVVLYPNPSVLVRSIENIRHPDIDPAAVQSLAATLPDNPQLVEQAVLDRLVPYSYDWQVSGVPWYFPTTSEVLKSKRGDCESRAVLLASILKAKGIPAQILMSFDHIWVQYPGKQSNALENQGLVLAQRVNGHFVWHWPKDFHLGAEIDAQLAMFWTPMPGIRKALLFGGLLLLVLINPLMSRYRRRAGLDEHHRLWSTPPSSPRSAWWARRPRLRARPAAPVEAIDPDC